jgi:carbon storage regulator
MLVLTRKLMEKLFIGDDICVTVVRLEGGQVRLGIDAPREVTVVRAELVPERLAARTRPSGAGTNPGRQVPHIHSDLRTPPPLLAHGNDSRRRGRSR